VPPRTALAYAAGAAATFGWASLYAVAKPALEEVTPVELALCRAAIAACALWVLAALVSRRGPTYVAREGSRSGRRVALVGVISFAGTSLLAMTAQRFLPASVNGLLNNLSPLWIAVYATFAGRARSGPLLVAGTVVASAGVAIVLLGGQSDSGGPGALPPTVQTALGVAISLSGSMLIAVSNVLTRRLMRGRDPLALTAAGAAWGTLPLLALTLFGAGGSFAGIFAASAATKLRLLWLGTGSTAFNFALWSFALAHLPVTRVIPLQYLIAPGSVALAVVLLGEPLGAHLVLGTAAILLGIALAQSGAERA
jgi:drug/metabolite transporter (DMT)-like permease